MPVYQWTIVGLRVLTNTLDIYDVAARSFTATQVLQDFGLSGSELVVVNSRTLIGMAIGFLTLGFAADRIGRRPAILLSVAAATVGMVLATMSPNVLVLGICRVLTGLRVGGILAGMYTPITPALYEPEARAKGVGIALGVGRDGAILAPILAGMLLGAGWTTVQLYLALAVVFLVGALVVGLIRNRPTAPVDRVAAKVEA